MIEHFKYDLIFDSFKKDSEIHHKKGVYCLMLGNECLYVGKSSFVGRRASRFFSYESACHGGRQEMIDFLFEIWKEPHPDFKIFIRLVDTNQEADDLESSWINGLKPRFNGYKKCYVNDLLRKGNIKRRIIIKKNRKLQNKLIKKYQHLHSEWKR